MDELQYEVISSQLAANILTDGSISFCDNLIHEVPEGTCTSDGSQIEGQYMDKSGDTTFFSLDPEKRFTPDVYGLEYVGEPPSFECHMDDEYCIVSIKWGEGWDKAGFLSAAPKNSYTPPTAGYLALESIQEKIMDSAAYKKAEDALFEAIGSVLFPNEPNARELTRNLYHQTLQHHHEVGTFPLKGAPVQSGICCTIDGKAHVVTRYGIATVDNGCYGDLLIDTSFTIHSTNDTYALNLNVFCNSDHAITYEFSGKFSLLNEQAAENMTTPMDIGQVLSSHYEDQKLVPEICTALQSITCEYNSHTSLPE